MSSLFRDKYDNSSHRVEMLYKTDEGGRDWTFVHEKKKTQREGVLTVLLTTECSSRGEERERRVWRWRWVGVTRETCLHGREGRARE